MRKTRNICEIGTDYPFEVPKPSLMLIEGSVNGIKTKLLVKTAVTLIHVSKKFCINHNICIQEGKNRVAIMANISIEAVDSMEGYVTVMRFVVNLQKYDFILGKN